MFEVRYFGVRSKTTTNTYFKSFWAVIFEVSKYILNKKNFEKILYQKISYFHVSAITWDLLYGFQFFEKIILGQYQVGIFLDSPCDSIGKNLHDFIQLGHVTKNLSELCPQQTVHNVKSIVKKIFTTFFCNLVSQLFDAIHLYMIRTIIIIII